MHCAVPDGTSVFSCMPTVTLVSTTGALLEETEKYRAGRKYTGPTGGATTMEDGESLESLDFVHSWSEADSQELPSSQKGLTAVPEDKEVYYSTSDEDDTEELITLESHPILSFFWKK